MLFIRALLIRLRGNPETAQRRNRALREDVRRFFDRCEMRQPECALAGQRREHAHQHSSEQRPRDPRFEASFRARSGDDARRRRFSCSKCRRKRIASGQSVDHLTRVARALRGIVRKTAKDDSLDRGIDVADEARRHRDLAGDLAHAVVQRPRVVCALAGEELVHHEAERVEIALHRCGLALQLLRRHVRGRAGDRAVVFARGERETEIHDSRVAVRVDHHVRRLEIAMEDALCMRGHESSRNAARDVDGLVVCESSDAAQQSREVFAVDVLHRDKVRAFPIDDVVETAHVRMRDHAPEADFVVQSREKNAIAGQTRGEKLQRDGLSELRIVRAVDLAHAAAAEDARDAIAARDDRAWRELSLRSAGRRRVAGVGIHPRRRVGVRSGHPEMVGL